ncbi:MAG: hypothetical protein LUE26_08470 [Alistipes sp.]|nr:hypothetical protein [Alistipes sp.]
MKYLIIIFLSLGVNLNQLYATEMSWQEVVDEINSRCLYRVTRTHIPSTERFEWTFVEKDNRHLTANEETTSLFLDEMGHINKYIYVSYSEDATYRVISYYCNDGNLVRMIASCSTTYSEIYNKEEFSQYFDIHRIAPDSLICIQTCYSGSNKLTAINETFFNFLPDFLGDIPFAFLKDTESLKQHLNFRDCTNTKENAIKYIFSDDYEKEVSVINSTASLIKNISEEPEVITDIIVGETVLVLKSNLEVENKWVEVRYGVNTTGYIEKSKLEPVARELCR